jgi:hypothetical protein
MLTVWALPALAIALLTLWLGAPAAPQERPDPAQAALVLVRLMALLAMGLFLVVLFAAPAAGVAQGDALPRALARAARRGVVGVAALAAAFQTLALLLTQLPGLMAGFVNPLMAQIFLAVGTIGGAAAAIGLFGRWLHAPAFAALDGLGALEALDASRAAARHERSFGFALGLGVLLAFFALASGAASVLADRAGVGMAGRAAASFLPLWVGLAVVGAAVAGRHLQWQAGERAPDAPTLALRSRPSRCPRCGELARAPTTGPAEVHCAACGLTARLR